MLFWLYMHKLKLQVGYFKEHKFYGLSDIFVWKILLMKKESAAMLFGSGTLLSQLIIGSNTGSNILIWVVDTFI